MNNDKLKRISKSLSELIKSHGNPQEVYDKLNDIIKKQKDYFSNIPPENIIKIVFYIWSLKQTGGFDLGDDMLDKISFAVLFENEGVYYSQDCPDCGGEGNRECVDCYGRGTIDCNECDGSGEETCPECDGSGQMEDESGEWVACDNCNGKETVDCHDCDGEGKVDCPDCNGSGYNYCSECDGNGSIETDEYLFNYYFIVTWNQDIKNRCEITMNSSEITMSEYEFDRLRDDYIKLYWDEEHSEFMSFVKESEMYCVYFNDMPKLIYSGLNMNIKISSKDYNFDFYTI